MVVRAAGLVPWMCCAQPSQETRTEQTRQKLWPSSK